jgi:hypothetical protein
MASVVSSVLPDTWTIADVLPGFQLPLRELFARAEAQGPPPG